MDTRLQQARETINEIDRQMAGLFVQRMRAAETIYACKKELGLPVQDEKREAELIERNSACVEDELLRGYYVDHLQHMLAVSRAYQYHLQNGLKVAYSGVEGAFAHIAAGRIFPGSSRIPCSDFKAAYDAVLQGECDVAVLPIENSFAGEVGQTIDLIFSGPLHINGIYELEIHQHLLGVPGGKAEEIRKVTSHPQALSQCHDYIRLRGFETEEASNTAVAARSVAEKQDRHCGAIASAETARLYGLEVLQPNVNQSSENTTRFAVLSRVRAASPALTCSVMMFTVRNEAGALARAISIIGNYGYNMTALRSRPLRRHSWQYYFYVEIDGTTDHDEGRRMLDELNGLCDQLKVAGVFAPHARI